MIYYSIDTCKLVIMIVDYNIIQGVRETFLRPNGIILKILTFAK